MATKIPDITVVFAQAIDSFRNTLTDPEWTSFQRYPNSKAMLQQISVTCSRHQHGSRLYRCCNQVARFCGAFEPYYDVINTFVQVKPDIMAPIWGSIRLIFQLGLNHVVFLEKAAGMFEELSTSLPQYEAYYQLCRNRASTDTDQSRLVSLMSYVYMDIVNFCEDILRVLSRQTPGSRFKQRLRLSRDTNWVPFDSKFDRLKTTMRMHRTLFEQELKLQDQMYLKTKFDEFQKFVHHFDNLSNAAKKTETLESIQRKIGNMDYRSTYTAAQRCRHCGTGDWFLKHNSYRTWRETSFASPWTQRLLSLQAKPGFGKTILSSFIIDDLAAYSITTQPAVVTTFVHFSASKQSGIKTSQEALRAIAAQLVHEARNDEVLVDSVSMLLNESFGGEQQVSEDIFSAMLKLLSGQSQIFVVIDGVDECLDFTTFLTKIMDLLTTAEIKVILLSRPDLKFPHSYCSNTEHDWQVTLSSPINQEAIQSYLEKQLRELEHEGLFGGRQIPQNTIFELAKRAEGMFLWAKLLVHYLECDALSPLERHETLEEGNLLEGLGAVYNKILDVLETRYKKQKQVAAHIFRWLHAAVYGLNAAELRVALAITPGEPTHELSMLPNWPQCLPKVTCALVEVNDGKAINVIHLSLLEFLENDPSCNSYFSLKDKKATNLHLGKVCLSYMIHDLPRQPLRPLEVDYSLEFMDRSCGGQSQKQAPTSASDNRALLLQKYPLLRYAILCWVLHLIRGVTLDKDSQEINGRGIGKPQKGRKRARSSCGEDDYQDDLAPSFASYSADLEVLESQPELSEGRPRKQSRVGTALRKGEIQFEAQGKAHNSNSRLDSSWIPLLSRFLLDRFTITMWVEACWSFSFPPSLYKLEPLFWYLSECGPLNTAAEREKTWVAFGLVSLTAALAELKQKHYDALMSNPTLIWQRHIVSATDPGYWPIWVTDTPKDEPEDEQRLVTVRAGFGSGQDQVPIAHHPRQTSSMIT